MTDPLQQVGTWLDEARAAGEPMPEAMALATATTDGVPSVRMVILRGLKDGLVFFTDADSMKGAELIDNPKAAVVLHWLLPANRQIRASGPVGEVAVGENDAYWSSRTDQAQENMTASRQSAVVNSRSELEARVEGIRRSRLPDARLPRPARWRGWRMTPESVEFWEEAPDGLHDRLRYRSTASGWRIERLEP